MNFKNLVIANITEVVGDLIASMPKKQADFEIREDNCICDRFIFTETDDQILVTPLPINPAFLNDSLKLLGLKNVINLFPENCGLSICKDILSDKKLNRTLMDLIRKNKNINVYSYAGTKFFADLVRYWRKQGLKFNTPELPDDENRYIQDFFGSKAGFRQAASLLGDDFLKMPEGAICSSKEEMFGWAGYLLKKGAGIVIKYNRGLAGAGLKIIKKEEVTGSVYDCLEKIIKEEIYFQKFPLVIEEFIPPDFNVCGGSPNVEMRIKNGKPELLYTCSMRVTLEGIFRGIEIGKEVMATKLAAILTKTGMKLGNYLAQKGYQGYFEIDFVAGIDGKIYPIEANLRRTGGTHVFEATQKLLGKNWAENYIVAKNIHDVAKLLGKNYEDIKQTVKHLLFPIKGKKEGVIFTSMGYLPYGKIGYLVIGKNKKSTFEIESKFLKLC